MTDPIAAPPAPADSDAMLVERAVAGDARAYELLVIKYQRRIERLIGRLVRDVDLVPDIAQETFLRAWLELIKPMAAAASASRSCPSISADTACRSRGWLFGGVMMITDTDAMAVTTACRSGG